jgi:hypothetical protein
VYVFGQGSTAVPTHSCLNIFRLLQFKDVSRKKNFRSAYRLCQEAGEWIPRGPPRPTIHRWGAWAHQRVDIASHSSYAAAPNTSFPFPSAAKGRGKKLPSSIQGFAWAKGWFCLSGFDWNEAPTWPRAGAGSAWLWRDVAWRGVTNLL